MKHRLFVTEGKDVSLRFPLPDAGKVTVGRGAGVDVRLNDEQVSRKHALIRIGPSGMAVFDLKSRNGVLINDVRIERAAPLRPGDRLRVGDTIMVLERFDRAGRTATEPEPVTRYVCLCCGGFTIDTCKRCGPPYLLPVFGIPGVTIEKKLGTGGMGAVFLARDLESDEMVAIKTAAFIGRPNHSKLTRFLREAKLPQQFTHGNIVRTIDTGSVIARPPLGALIEGQEPCKAAYIVLEYVMGRDLREMVGKDGPLEIKFCLRILLKVADVLAHAHEKGIVHRDIKPQNIMLNEHGVVKVMDFGLAKCYEESGLGDVTATGSSFGTPAFMAPEQIHDAKTVDHRADIFSFGATLFFVLAGRPPFKAPRLGDTLKQVLTMPAPRVEDFRAEVPRELSDIIHRCLAKTPEERFDTPALLQEELEKVFFNL
jgi:hypothetical protein